MRRKCKAFWMFMLKIYLEGVRWAAMRARVVKKFLKFIGIERRGIE
jgi:hypothetical protein